MGIIIDRMGIGQFGTEGGDIMDFYGVCILILVLYGIGLLIGLIQAAANSRARERQKMTPEERAKINELHRAIDRAQTEEEKLACMAEFQEYNLYLSDKYDN